MEKCFICGQECYSTFFKRNVFVRGIPDPVTGETFDFCANCARKYNSRETAQVMLGLKRNSVRETMRGLYELGKLTPSDFEFIHSVTVELLAKKYLKNCTGYLIYNIDQYLLFDEVNRQMLLNGSSVCSFEDVIDYKVLDHSVDFNVHSPESTEYSTKSKNALGRAVLGKVFAGSAGALVGGLTAKHSLSVQKSGFSTYTTTSHDYSIVIRLKRLGNNSAILSIGESEEEMNTLCNALDTVISLKNENAD